MLEALWTVEYATNHGDFGTGVAVLVDGRIYGGDTHYCYEGTYRRVGDELIARVDLCLHSGDPAPALAVGDSRVAVYMRGRLADNELELTGVLEQEPGTKLFIHMQRKCGVPTPQRLDAPAGDRQRGEDAAAAGEGTGERSAYLIGESTERLPLF